MFGIKYLKFQPSEYILRYNGGKLIAQGAGLSDGIESDFLEFCSGVEAAITVAEKKGYLVV